MKINELIIERNRIEALIECYNAKQTNINASILIHEVLNFIDGVGAGFTEKNNKERYYSSIEGVKNFYINVDNVILCKITHPVSLPSTIKIRGEIHTIGLIESSKYSRQIVHDERNAECDYTPQPRFTSRGKRRN